MNTYTNPGSDWKSSRICVYRKRNWSSGTERVWHTLPGYCVSYSREWSEGCKCRIISLFPENYLFNFGLYFFLFSSFSIDVRKSKYSLERFLAFAAYLSLPFFPFFSEISDLISKFSRTEFESLLDFESFATRRELTFVLLEIGGIFCCAKSRGNRELSVSDGFHRVSKLSSIPRRASESSPLISKHDNYARNCCGCPKDVFVKHLNGRSRRHF